MTIEEFTARTGISAVEAYFRWSEILKAYYAFEPPHKNEFCLYWLHKQGRDDSQCRQWLEVNDPDALTVATLLEQGLSYDDCLQYLDENCAAINRAVRPRPLGLGI